MNLLVRSYITLILIVLGITVLIAPPVNGKWEEFGRVATIGITAASSLIAAITSLFNLKEQTKAVRRHLVLEAYRELFGAAHNYYRTLAPLETGDWDINLVRQAEEGMVKAGKYLFYLDAHKAHQDLWESFWQRARAIAERTNKDLHDSEGRKKFWKEQAGFFGELLDCFKKAAASQLESF